LKQCYVSNWGCLGSHGRRISEEVDGLIDHSPHNANVVGDWGF